MTNPLQSKNPRHIIRAQGRSAKFPNFRENRFGALREEVVRERLLNYLSTSAAQSERSLLDERSVHNAGSSSSAAQMLDLWLSARTRNNLEEDGEARACTWDEGYMPKAQYDLDESPQAEPKRPRETLRSRRFNRNGSPTGFPQPTSAKASGKPTSPFSQGRRVEVRQGSRGERCEVFPGGASMLKDDLGRVKEIVTGHGLSVLFNYDEKGHLLSFERVDKRGRMHSRAEVDHHGVLVRDAGGRVKAQGETMQVDPFGCVSISREDGQFWSLDLLRSVHIERRMLADDLGKWHAMTALFTADGFRMATRFRPVSGEHAADTLSGGSGLYRFYGRDGSIVEFSSDGDLEQLRPSAVLQAGTKPVAPKHLGLRQAGTAWESLREYVFNYLAAI